MNIQNLAANTIRILAAEAIQKANSGHPGMPLGRRHSAPARHHHHAQPLSDGETRVAAALSPHRRKRRPGAPTMGLAQPHAGVSEVGDGRRVEPTDQ